MRSATFRAVDNGNPQGIPTEVLEALTRLVRELRFGSIEIVVHEGRITQIERRERLRFGPVGTHRSE
jgi:hypothetical protein